MKLIIWGAGSCAREYMRQLDPSHTVVAIVDNNAAVQGTTLGDIPIHPPQDLPRLGPYDFLVIASIYSRSIQAQIESEGLAPPDKVLSVYQTPVRASSLTTQPHPANAYSPELLARIDNRRWYHAIEVQPRCHTPGNVLPQSCFLDYPQVRDLTGKRVLDIGAWDGGYTFLAEGRGASVTAYDIQDPDYSGFNIAKDMLGSKANHILGSVYDLNREQHGAYDVVLYFGVFYHLFDPLRAFCAINSVLDAGGYMLFEGAILDHAYNVDATWQPMRDNMEPYTMLPLTYYTRKTYWNNDQSTWFVPNMACLREWILSAGFEVLETHVIEDISRGYGLARKVRPPLPEHEILQDPSLSEAFA